MQTLASSTSLGQHAVYTAVSLRANHNKSYSDTVSLQPSTSYIFTARLNILSSIPLSYRVMRRYIKGLKSDEFNWWYHTIWPKCSLLLSDGRKAWTTMFVYALWISAQWIPRTTASPRELLALSFCKPSLLNNHYHSQRGWERHLFFVWTSSFARPLALESCHGVCVCTSEARRRRQSRRSHWPADGVDLVRVLFFAGVVCQAVSKGHQTLSKALVDGVTPSGRSGGTRTQHWGKTHASKQTEELHLDRFRDCLAIVTLVYCKLVPYRVSSLDSLVEILCLLPPTAGSWEVEGGVKPWTRWQFSAGSHQNNSPLQLCLKGDFKKAIHLFFIVTVKSYLFIANCCCISQHSKNTFWLKNRKPIFKLSSLRGYMHQKWLCDYYNDYVQTDYLLQVRRISQVKRKRPEYWAHAEKKQNEWRLYCLACRSKFPITDWHEHLSNISAEDSACMPSASVHTFCSVLGDEKTKGGEMNCFGSFFLLPSAVFLLSELISLLIHLTGLIVKQVMHTDDYLPPDTVSILNVC